MEPTNGEITVGNPLQYPYNAHKRVPNPFQDVYNRMPNWLLASLSRYGHLVQSKEASLPYEQLDNVVATLTRFSEDSLQSSDFNVLSTTFPPGVFPTRHVFESHILQQKEGDICVALHTKLGDIQKYEQLVFPHCLTEEQWVVFLVLPSQSVIEIYLIGEMDTTNVKNDTMKLYRALRMAGLKQQFQTTRRLQVPLTFAVNPVAVVVFLTRDLHYHHEYLDLSHEMILQRKLCLLKDLVKFHDQWLAQLTIRNNQNKSHPFITLEYQQLDNFPELKQMGWLVHDVLGDGNCGFYSLLLGLENNGQNRYSPSVRGVPNLPMEQNLPWQLSVITFRKDLQDHSEHLLESIYNHGNRPVEWFHLTTALTDDDIDKLSDSFFNPKISQRQYFDWTLTKKDKKTDYTDYQMNPYWSCLVASSRFNMRVIVYTRNASFEKSSKTVTYSWSTTTMNASLPIEHHIVQVDEIRKITDVQFKEMPTIEVLYTTGFIAEKENDSQHFQFLRRIICHDVPMPTAPSPTPLMDFIQPSLEIQNPNSPLEPNTNSPSEENTSKTSERNPRTRGKSLHLQTSQSKGTKATSVRKGKVSRPKAKQNIVRKNATAKHIREKKRIMEELTASFDRQLETQKSKHKTPTLMKYDPQKKQFFTRIKGTDGKLQRAVRCRNTMEYDDELVKAAQLHANEWVGPSMGDCGDGVAPTHLIVGGIKTLYEQHANRFCFTYSLASALFYCKHKAAAIELAGQAPRFAKMHRNQAITELKEFMKNLVPVIGSPTYYGIRTKRSSRKKRTLTWDDLFNIVTPYPTLVVPVTVDGNATHAFCVIDDLIFDSISPYPLKLQKESVDWIFNGVETQIDFALRFNTKVSPQGVVVKEKYQHQVTYHWDHPSRPNEPCMDTDEEHSRMNDRMTE